MRRQRSPASSGDVTRCVDDRSDRVAEIAMRRGPSSLDVCWWLLYTVPGTMQRGSPGEVLVNPVEQGCGIADPVADLHHRDEHLMAIAGCGGYDGPTGVVGEADLDPVRARVVPEEPVEIIDGEASGAVDLPGLGADHFAKCGIVLHAVARRHRQVVRARVVVGRVQAVG